MNDAEKLILLSKVSDCFEWLDELSTQKIGGKFPITIKNQLNEESVLTTGDWARLGVITGLLWTKLDQIINELKNGNRDRQDVGRKLSDLSYALRK